MTDTPRTQAGRAAHWRWHGEQVCPADVGQECTVAGHIQSIEAEAAADSLRSSEPGESVGPAAAEPVLREAADWILQIGLPAGAETWRPEYEALLAKIDAAIGAAQPPRGVTPALDVSRLERAFGNCRLQLHEDVWYVSEHDLPEVAAEYARLGSPEESPDGG